MGAGEAAVAVAGEVAVAVAVVVVVAAVVVDLLVGVLCAGNKDTHSRTSRYGHYSSYVNISELFDCWLQLIDKTTLQHIKCILYVLFI